MQKYSVSKWLWKAMSIFSLQVSLLLIACSVSLAHTNYAQDVLDREVTLDLKQVPFEKALAEIEMAAHVRFNYVNAQFKPDELISVSVQNKKLKEVLSELLTPRGIEYVANNNTEFVTLKKSRKKASDKQSILAIPAETRDVTLDAFNYASITGTVTDGATNQAMAGVNVLVKGTTNGTNTDKDGHYTLNAENNDVLIFSFIGYKAFEASVNSRSVIDVVMEEDAKSLQEVVVNAGYWNVKEKEATGNISKVNSDVIDKQPVSNPLSALQGRMPGVYITQSGGLPGSAFNIQIRGQNSLRQTLNDNGNTPLYLVDGVPYISNTLAFRSLSSPINFGSPLNNINPNDIESIEVLKDADATAIYGSRGANGVVLITTKKGKQGKSTVDFDFYQGVGTVSRMMDLLNTEQYLTMRREAFKNDNATPQFWHYDMTWDTTQYTNWQKELLGGTANTTNAQLSIAGGSANTRFLIGASYFKEGTVLPGDLGYQRYSTHINLSHSSPDQKFKINFSANINKDVNNLGLDPTASAVVLPPNSPKLLNEDGSYNWDNPTTYNPLAALSFKFQAKNQNYIGNLQLGYMLIKNLELKASIGYNNLNLNELRTVPIKALDPSYGLTTGEARFSTGNNEGWIAEPQIEYKRDIALGKLNILLGSTFQESTTETETLAGQGFLSDNSLENIAAAGIVTVDDYKYIQYRYAALFARVNFEWDGRYIVNLTARRDGSSRFGPGNQFGNFGAAGIAWIFSNESFIKNNLSFLSFGKLRSSYGTTGNDQIPDYGYMDTFSYTSDSYLNVRGLQPSRLANRNYSWEVNNKFEVAIELGFWQDRVLLSSSYYHNRSSNQLVGYSLPAITGFTSIQSNLPATVRNTGVEANLQYRVIDNNNLKWSTSLNITLPRNKLLAYPGIEKSSYATTYAIGQSIYTKYRYEYSGVDTETGLYTFVDNNDDGSASLLADGKFKKEVAQEFYGGFLNTFQYKGFQLDIFVQFVKQTGINELALFLVPGSYGNRPESVMGRWQQPGDNSSIQKFTQNSATTYSRWTNSDNSIEDTSFARLKNVSLSYTLPTRISEKIKATNCKIFIQGQNLLTLTDYKGLNPEVSSLSLPPLRVLAAGFHTSF